MEKVQQSSHVFYSSNYLFNCRIDHAIPSHSTFGFSNSIFLIHLVKLYIQIVTSSLLSTKISASAFLDLRMDQNPCPNQRNPRKIKIYQVRSRHENPRQSIHSKSKIHKNY